MAQAAPGAGQNCTGAKLLASGNFPPVGLAECAPKGQTVGIDLGAEQLDGARALARDLDVKNVTFRQGDIFALPCEDDNFGTLPTAQCPRATRTMKVKVHDGAGRGLSLYPLQGAQS